MLSVRVRVLAFAPLVVLTLLTAAAAVAGYRTSDAPAGSAAVEKPSASPGPTPSSPTPGPYSPLPEVTALVPVGGLVSVGQARQSWDRAIDKLINAASGKYSWAVYYGADPEPLQSETGGFDLDPFQSSFDRTIAVGKGKKQVVHVRRIDETSYLQFDHWGSWTGCWLRLTNDQLEQQTGVDFTDALPLPVGVLAITDAVVTKHAGYWFGAPYREYGAQVNAAEALQFLGISGQVLQKHLARLVKIDVPITISLDAQGRLHGGGARGSQVAAAITKAAPNLLQNVVAGLPRLRAAFAVKGLGSPVSVRAPLPKSILPLNARSNDSCDAGGPRA